MIITHKKELSKNILLFLVCLHSLSVNAQNRVDSFWIHGDVKVTIDRPENLVKKSKTLVIFYALPNGNSTEQTMGKKRQPGDDWHFDIQHIRAQTAFIRKKWSKKNIVVIYLENRMKSWPAWKKQHGDFAVLIPAMVDSLSDIQGAHQKEIYLNGHSGGGSFIFGYVAGVSKIPARIKRISFIDSNYGYDSSYYPKFKNWLVKDQHASLNIFAYNDSVALYNGKPVVSATGGTWFRSRLMLWHLQQDFLFETFPSDSIDVYKSRDRRIQFFFKPNGNRGIYHTQQVELNGFIHSVLCGTKHDSDGYQYYGKRAYDDFVE